MFLLQLFYLAQLLKKKVLATSSETHLHCCFFFVMLSFYQTCCLTGLPTCDACEANISVCLTLSLQNRKVNCTHFIYRSAGSHRLSSLIVHEVRQLFCVVSPWFCVSTCMWKRASVYMYKSEHEPCVCACLMRIYRTSERAPCQVGTEESQRARPSSFNVGIRHSSGSGEDEKAAGMIKSLWCSTEVQYSFSNLPDALAKIFSWLRWDRG